jgi:hypothetical protein
MDIYIKGYRPQAKAYPTGEGRGGEVEDDFVVETIWDVEMVIYGDLL